MSLASRILADARAAQRLSGKSVPAQLKEIAELRSGPYRLLPSEYFAFGLYDDKRFTPEQKRQFVGLWSKRRVYAQNARTWAAVGDDKLLSYALFDSYGLPYAKVVAVAHPTRLHPGVTILRDADAIARWLREEAPLPLFGKPVTGTRAGGAYLIERVDPDTDEIVLADGSRQALTDFAGYTAHRVGGYLFQELVRPHPDLVAFSGARPPSARLFIINGRRGPVLHRAGFRIPVGPGMIDNFAGGSTGNIAAAIDLESGRLGRAIASIRMGAPEVTHHPTTGHPIRGYVVPLWRELVDTAMRAAAMLQGLRLQGWDMVPSDRGAMTHEVNVQPDFFVLQLPAQQGLAVGEAWREMMTPGESAPQGPSPPWKKG